VKEGERATHAQGAGADRSPKFLGHDETSTPDF